MSNVNLSLEGHISRVVDAMVSSGYVKTKAEALRLALFEFNRSHNLVPDEESAYALVAQDIAAGVDSGRIKTKEFNLRELD